MPNQQLVNYIRTNLQKGVPIEQIKQSLIASRYSESDINEAISLAQEAKPIKKPSKKLWIIFAVIGVIVLVGILSFFLVGEKLIPTTEKEVSSEKESSPQKLPTAETLEIEIKAQMVKFNLPSESPLDNEDLKLSSFYQTIDIRIGDIKSRKEFPIDVTDTKDGQILMLSKELESEKLKYNLPIYIERTDEIYTLDVMSIAKGLVWMNPVMMFQDKSLKPLLMDKISKDNIFTKTIYNELRYLIETKPEEIGGDFQGERGDRLIKLVTGVIEDNLEEKVSETKTPDDYYDCGNSKSCLSDQAKNCELTKGKTSDYGTVTEHLIKGEEDEKCLYHSKILESSFGLAGLEIECKLSKEILSKSFTQGLDQETLAVLVLMLTT